MKTDNALRKALLKPTDELPYGFENRIMRQILLESERRGKHSYYRALALVAFVSLLLVAGLIYVLNTFFGINLLEVLTSFQLPDVEPTSFLNDQTKPILAFSLYIGALMLLLLGLDFVFRRRFRKSRN